MILRCIARDYFLLDSSNPTGDGDD
jgi:hypothetical protein